MNWVLCLSEFMLYDFVIGGVMLYGSGELIRRGKLCSDHILVVYS